MSSLVRRMQRKWKRALAEYEPNPQPTVHTEDGGYITLHPTKGWQKVSGKRVRIFSTNK